MPTLEEKQIYFDQYWHEQPDAKTDPRSMQRAGMVHRMLTKESGRLFDLGCGRGLILDYFARLGYDVVGSDVSPQIVTAVSQKGHRAMILDIERDEPYEKYDIILCLEVLQQLYYPLRALKRLKDALEDDGELVISVPNEFHIISRLKILFGASNLGHFTHSHVRLFAPSRDKLLFEKTNLIITDRKYVPIISPRRKLLTKLFIPLAKVFPSLFAISSIYKLRKL